MVKKEKMPHQCEVPVRLCLNRIHETNVTRVSRHHVELAAGQVLVKLFMNTHNTVRYCSHHHPISWAKKPAQQRVSAVRPAPGLAWASLALIPTQGPCLAARGSLHPGTTQNSVTPHLSPEEGMFLSPAHTRT